MDRKNAKEASEFLDRNILDFDKTLNSSEIRDLVMYCENRFVNGGALHIILDDGNYEDCDVEFCASYLSSGEYEKVCKEQGWPYSSQDIDVMKRLLKLLAPLTEEEREMIIEGKTITEELFDILYNKALS